MEYPRPSFRKASIQSKETKFLSSSHISLEFFAYYLPTFVNTVLDVPLGAIHILQLGWVGVKQKRYFSKH